MFHPKRSGFKIFLIGFVFVSTLLCLLGGLYLNGIQYHSGSDYPLGIYQLKAKDSDYAHGDLVLFCPPNNVVARQALHNGALSPGICEGGFAPRVKKIMGLRGDYVTVGPEVSINGLVLPLASIRGKAMHHYEFQLQEGEYFMMLTRHSSDSIDSRHYGPVASENVIGLMHPIWIWKKIDSSR
ncbi:conjugative transfer signal peptidase TraF [Vibrio parahaemolyticus]|nr:conjugative transfer signal peptidase TraF [Vibrio parahaemolyticus]